MIKEIYKNVTLECVMQEEIMLVKDCRRGTLSVNEQGIYRFEEHVAEKAKTHNPKLFNGTYLSIVRLKDGRYQPYFKVKGNRDDLLREDFIEKLIEELTMALLPLRSSEPIHVAEPIHIAEPNHVDKPIHVDEPMHVDEPNREAA